MPNFKRSLQFTALSLGWKFCSLGLTVIDAKVKAVRRTECNSLLYSFIFYHDTILCELYGKTKCCKERTSAPVHQQSKQSESSDKANLLTEQSTPPPGRSHQKKRIKVKCISNWWIHIYIWVSFCRTGKTSVICHFFVKSRRPNHAILMTFLALWSIIMTCSCL